MDRLRQDIMAGPDLFAQKLDPAAETLLLVRLSREAFRAASFLDDRILTAQTQGSWYKLSSIEVVLAGAPQHCRCTSFFTPANRLHPAFSADRACWRSVGAARAHALAFTC